jgi:integrase
MSKRLNGEGSIRRRPGGRWEARVRLSVDGADPQRVSVYGRTREEVRRKLGELRRRANAGQPLRDSGRTVGSWAGEWMADSLPLSGRRPTTVDTYRSLTRTHVVPALGALPLAALRPTHVERLLGDLSAHLSPSTCRQVYAVLRAMLDVAVRDGLVARNVAVAVARPSVPVRTPRVVEPAKVRELVAAAVGDRLRPLLVLVATTGLRRGEALGLRWSDLDLDGGSLRVARSLLRTSSGLHLDSEPKTARGRRTVPLAPATVEVLREHRVRQLEERMQAPVWHERGLVFATEIGGALEPRNVSRWYADLAARCGVEDRGMHALRHFAATGMLESGATVRTVADVLGHADVSVTLNVYASSADEAQRRAVAGLATGLGL